MEKLLMPKAITAEGGHKSLLIGEFYETIEVRNEDYCGCGKCDYCLDVQDEDAQEYISQKVTVSWATIKDIYSKIVAFENNKLLVK